MNINSKEILAKYIDQTCLSHFATEQEILDQCKRTIPYKFKTFVVNAAMISQCKEILQDTGIGIDTAISFPQGQGTIESKVYETENAIKVGANEIDYVCNIVKVKSQDWNYIKDEMKRIVSVCQEHAAVCKVIFENCYLIDDEKKKLCEIASEIKPDFIKTSTGFGKSGASIEDVILMRKHTDPEVKIKAAGGVKTLNQVLALIDAGVERIGTSNGFNILDEYEHTFVK